MKEKISLIDNNVNDNMVKRIVVAGCIDYNNYDEAKEFIDECICDIRNEYKLIFISGGCRGADALGERYEKENGFEIDRIPADWKRYGRAAGPKRNKQMAQIADLVICFWDGQSRGTKSMIDYTKEMNKPIRKNFINRFRKSRLVRGGQG